MRQRNFPKSHNQVTGARGEALAAKWLDSGGYFIMELNWRHGRLEIDIIAQKKDTLHFIEVKTVTTDVYGCAEEKVDKKKMKRMLLAASHYLRLSHWDGAVQFDVLAILMNFTLPEYSLFEDIWP